MRQSPLATRRFNSDAAAVDEKGAQWLCMHLLIRDYFILTALKHPRAVFDGRGIQGEPVAWESDAAAFGAWAAGRTGLPFVDAGLRELAATGYTSNRCRQNAASVLAKTLRLDWRLGAQVRRTPLVSALCSVLRPPLHCKPPAARTHRACVPARCRVCQPHGRRGCTRACTGV